jgi:hypothetical protein
VVSIFRKSAVCCAADFRSCMDVVLFSSRKVAASSGVLLVIWRVAMDTSQLPLQTQQKS